MVDSPEKDRAEASDYVDSADMDTDGFGPSTVENDVILELRDLRTYFQTAYGTVKAVDGVSYHVKRGETLGVRTRIDGRSRCSGAVVGSRLETQGGAVLI